MNPVIFNVKPINDEESLVSAKCGDASLHFRTKWRPTVLELQQALAVFVAQYYKGGEQQNRLVSDASEPVEELATLNTEDLDLLAELAECPIECGTIEPDEQATVQRLLEYDLISEALIETEWMLTLTRSGHQAYLLDKERHEDGEQN